MTLMRPVASAPYVCPLLLAADTNAKIVNERLGHATIAITLDIYSHVLPTMQQQATSKLERLLYQDGTKVDTP